MTTSGPQQSLDGGRTSVRLEEEGKGGAASVQVRDLVAAFNACATAHSLDSSSDAHFRALTERLRSAFPFACKSAWSVPSTATNRSVHSTPPAFLSALGNDGSRRAANTGTPPASAGEDDGTVRLVPLSRAASEPSPVLGEGVGTAPVAEAFAVETSSNPSSARSPRAASVLPEEEAALKEALPAIRAVLDGFGQFLRETMRAAASAPVATVNRMFDDESEDSDKEAVFGSPVVHDRYTRVERGGAGGVTISSNGNGLYRSSGVTGVSCSREDSLGSPAPDQSPSPTFAANDSDRSNQTRSYHQSSGTTRPRAVPGFLTGSESALWQSVTAVSDAVCTFIRQAVFTKEGDDGVRGTPAPSRLVGGQRRVGSRSRSTSPAGGSCELPLSVTQSQQRQRQQHPQRPSPSVVALRKAVLAYVRAQILQGLYQLPTQLGQPQSQHNQFDVPHRSVNPNSFSTSDLGATKCSPREGTTADELDKSIDRVVVSWWVWSLSSMGIADDPIFLIQEAKAVQAGGGGGGSGARQQNGMGFLLSVTDYLAACYAKAQAREGAAFDLATFLNYAGVDVNAEELVDRSVQQAAGTPQYDGATFATVTAMDSAACMSDSTTLPDGVNACLPPTSAHSAREHGSLPRASLPNQERGGGGGLSAFMHSGSGRATPYDGNRPSVGGAAAGRSGAAANGAASVPRSLVESRGGVGESTDAYASHILRSVMKNLHGMEDESEEMLDTSPNRAGVIPTTRASYASVDRILRDAAAMNAGAGGSSGAVMAPAAMGGSDYLDTGSLFASAAQRFAPNDNEGVARGARPSGSEEAGAPRLSKIAEAEQTVSRAGKAIQFGVKLGALYATQDMNALLSLLPSSSDPVSPLVVNCAAATNDGVSNGRQGSSSHGKGLTGSNAIAGNNSNNGNNGTANVGVDVLSATSATMDMLSPLDEGSRAPVSGTTSRGLLIPQAPLPSPSTAATTPSYRYQSLPHLLQGHGGGDRHSGGGGAGAGVGRGGAASAGGVAGRFSLYDPEGGRVGFHGLHNKLRTSERRTRMQDLCDYADHSFGSLHSPAAFVADPEVNSELAFCLCLILLNRVVTTALAATAPPPRSAEAVASVTFSVFGISMSVWRSLVPSITETCVCALMQALDRQHVILAQELADFLAVLVSTTTTSSAGEGDPQPRDNVPSPVGDEVASGASTNRYQDPVASPSGSQNGGGPPPQQSALNQGAPRRLVTLSPSMHTVFPRMWLASFTQVADMAKHLLSCGHGSPKPLESATWYLAGMADYLERVRVLIPGSPGAADTLITTDSSSAQQRTLLSGVATSPAVQAASAASGSAEEVVCVVREVITNADSYFRVIVGFMEALADVFTRDVVESGLMRHGEMSDLSGSRNKFANVYRPSSCRHEHIIAGGGGIPVAGSGFGDDAGGEVEYPMRRSRQTPANSDDGVDDALAINSRRARAMDSGSANAADDVEVDVNDDDGDGGEDNDGSLKEHYKWMELCVHYFLEIFDHLMEASLHLRKKPLFLYTLVVGLTRGGSLEDSYPGWVSSAAVAAGAGRNREGSVAGNGNNNNTTTAVGPPPAMLATRFPFESGSSTRVDSAASGDSLNRLQHFLNAYCGMVVQRAVNGRLSLNTDLLVSYGLLEKGRSGLGTMKAQALAAVGVTPLEGGGNSTTSPSLSASTMQGPAAVASPAFPEHSQLSEGRSGDGNSRSRSTSSTRQGRPAEEHQQNDQQQQQQQQRQNGQQHLPRPSTMWWPSQPFQSRRHVVRVTEHATLISAFLQEPISRSAMGHLESEESSCRRAMRRRRNQVGGSSLFFSTVSSLLDTANGPCTQLLSFPCACPALAGGAHGAGGGGGGGAFYAGTSNRNNNPSNSSSTLTPPLAMAPSVTSATNASGTRALAALTKTNSHNRSVITSDKALLSVCGGLWLRVRMLALLSVACAPMDREQGSRFSRSLRSSLPDIQPPAVRQHYRAISTLIPYSFSALPGTASATYVRLLFLRVVQAFYSDRRGRGGSGGAGGAGVCAGLATPAAGTAAAAMSPCADEDGVLNTTWNNETVAGLSPVLCQVTGKLWSAYFYQLLHALTSLCWNHVQAHTTAATLSIPSVLSRFLQVIMEDEAAASNTGSHSHSHFVYSSSTGHHHHHHASEEEEVGLLVKRLDFWRGTGLDDGVVEEPTNFKDFEDSEDDEDHKGNTSGATGDGGVHAVGSGKDEDGEGDDAFGDRNPLRATQPLRDTMTVTTRSSSTRNSKEVVRVSVSLELDAPVEGGAVHGSRTHTQPQREDSVQVGSVGRGGGEDVGGCKSGGRKKGPVGEGRAGSGGGSSSSPVALGTEGERPPLAPQALLLQIPQPPPLVVPKLSLAGLGPALYFASSGDTGAAQEAQFLLNTPSTLTARPRNERKPKSSNVAYNHDDDHEGSSVGSPSARDVHGGLTSHSAREIAALEESQNSTVTPRTPVPEPFQRSNSALSMPGGSGVSTTPPPPPAPPMPFNIPKLSLAGLGPALYFASSGDTGAFMELSALNPATPQAAPTKAHTAAATSSPSAPSVPPAAAAAAAATVGPPTLNLSERAAAQVSSNTTADAGMSPHTTTSDEEDTATQVPPAELLMQARSEQSALSTDVCSGFVHGPDEANSMDADSAQGNMARQESSGSSGRKAVTGRNGAATPAPLAALSRPLPVPPLCFTANGKGPSSTDAERHPSPSPTKQQRSLPTVPAFQSSLSPSFGANIRPATPLNPEIIAELIICLTGLILQRDSGFIQYSFTVSSLTQRRAHMSYAVSQPRMLYGILFDASERSTRGRGGGRFAAAAAAAPHGPSTYHVVQSLTQYLLQRAHAPVVAILKEWMERRYGGLMKQKFASDVEGPARAGWEEEREFIVTADIVKDEIHGAPSLSLGHFTLLRLLLPDRKLLPNFFLRRRIGSGGFGAVVSATPVSHAPRSALARFPTSPTGGGGGGGPPAPPLSATAPPATCPANSAAADNTTNSNVSSEQQANRFLFETSNLAVKMMPLHLQGSESGALPVCHAEALAMLRLRRHPHISTALSFGCTSKDYFLITPEYGGGSFLSWRLKDYPPGFAALKQVRRMLDTNEDFTLFSICAELFTQVLQAVSYAHGHHIRHGDIKADNVFVSKSTQVLTLTKEELEGSAPGQRRRSEVLLQLAVRVRLGDFGSCDPCEDDDIRALLRDLETGEGRFLSGRWGSGKGTEAIQPPEVMVPKRRYEILSGIVKAHRSLRLERKAAHTARSGNPLSPRDNSIPAQAAAAAGTGAPATASPSTVGIAPSTTTTTAATRTTSVFLQNRTRSTEEDGNGDIGGGYFEAVAADLRRAELSVDIWACGCLLYEMLTGRMLFGEGRLGRLGVLANSSPRKSRGTTANASGSVSRCRGTNNNNTNRNGGSGSPNEADNDSLPDASAGNRHGSRRGAADALNWERDDLLPHVGERVVGFLSRLLSLDPMQRPTAEEALYGWQEIIAKHPLMPRKG